MTPPVSYGIKNYVRLLSDAKFLKALKNTLKLMVMIVPLQTVLAIVISTFLVSNRDMLIGKIANSVIFIPVLCSNAVTGVIWRDTYYEAAKVDGAGAMRRFFGITLPMLKPTIILALFLSITSSLQCFDLIYTLTGGGPNNASTTLVVYAYTLCFGAGSAGYAMAISNVLFLVILIIAMLQRGMIRRDASEI